MLNASMFSSESQITSRNKNIGATLVLFWELALLVEESAIVVSINENTKSMIRCVAVLTMFCGLQRIDVLARKLPFGMSEYARS
jgi:hypothetical protein